MNTLQLLQRLGSEGNIDSNEAAITTRPAIRLTGVGGMFSNDAGNEIDKTGSIASQYLYRVRAGKFKQ